MLPYITQTRAAALCFLICAGFAVAGLYPFNFSAANAARWLTPGPGLLFMGHSMMRTPGAFDLSAAPGVTFEFLMEPSEEPTRELGTFLSIYDGRLPENLMMAQWKAGFLVRTPLYDARGRRRPRELGSTSGLKKGASRFIAVASGSGGTRLYADGALVESFPKVTLAPATLRGTLMVGAGARGVGDWKGKLLGMAIFSTPLSASEIASHCGLWQEGRAARLASDPAIAGLYLLDQGSGRTVRDASARGVAFELPQFYRVPAKAVLETPWDDWDQMRFHSLDVIVNIAGFIPFGFFFCIYLSRARYARPLSNVFWTAVLSAALSLVIELLQVFIPSRSSSLTDLLCNALGGLVGAMVATKCDKVRVTRYE
jgi:VanZ family protein